jgi:hypothetical protein
MDSLSEPKVEKNIFKGKNASESSKCIIQILKRTLHSKNIGRPTGLYM